MIEIPLRDQDSASDQGSTQRPPLLSAWLASALCLVLGLCMTVGGAAADPPFVYGIPWELTEGLQFEWAHALEWAQRALQVLGGAVATAGALGAVATAALHMWIRGAEPAPKHR